MQSVINERCEIITTICTVFFHLISWPHTAKQKNIFELTSNVPKPSTGIFSPLLSVMFGALTILITFIAFPLEQNWNVLNTSRLKNIKTNKLSEQDFNVICDTWIFTEQLRSNRQKVNDSRLYMIRLHRRLERNKKLDTSLYSVQCARDIVSPLVLIEANFTHSTITCVYITIYLKCTPS